MPHQDSLIKERLKFLSQEPARLRGIRGVELYDTLGQLGLTHGQFFRAIGANIDDYCAQEFGIDINKVTVERFFQSDPAAKWLFPEVVRDSVIAGMKRKPLYPELIAGDERVSGTAYDVPYVVESEDNESLRSVAEGAAIPESEIQYGDRIVRLEKLGRGVIASYEVVRRMSVDLLRIHLRRIGERLGRNIDQRVAQVLVNGDDSGAITAPVVLNTATAGAWTYDDVLKGFMTLGLEHYFTPTHMLADAALSRAILAMEPFKDSALFDFAKTGNLPTPLGVKLLPLEDQPPDTLTILDAGYAVQKLTEQDLLIENDKLINQQWERTYVTLVADFAVLYPKARILVRSNWS